MRSGFEALEGYYRELERPLQEVPAKRGKPDLWSLSIPTLAAAAAYVLLYLCSQGHADSASVPDGLYRKQRLSADVEAPIAPSQKRAEAVFPWDV